MNDPIVDEVRQVRDAHASRFNYDLDAIFRDIKEKEKTSGREFRSFPPRGADSPQTPEPIGDAVSTTQESVPMPHVRAT
jgi:hypothetical protein